MDDDYGHWKYPGNFDPDDWFGFIYRVIDITNDKEYIGKKQFTKVRRKIVKGKTRRKVVTSASDWRSYTTSSKYVNEAILEKGKDNFLFLIESLHKTKAGLHYAEIETQIDEDVLRALLEDGTRKFYNGCIGNIKFIPPVESPEETKAKITQTLRVRWMNADHHFLEAMTAEEQQNWNDRYRIDRTAATVRGKNDPKYARHLLESRYSPAKPPG